MAEIPSGKVPEKFTGELAGVTFTTNFIAGWFGGCAGVFVGYPFDTVKVHLQTQEIRMSFRGTVLSIKDFGMSHGFYRGLSFPLAYQGAAFALFFAGYGTTSEYLRLNYSDAPDTAIFRSFVAGCVGGGVQAIPGCPMEVVKCNLQARIAPGSKRYFRGPIDCLRTVYRQHGLRGCFRGLGIHTTRDTISYGVYTSSELYFFSALSWMDTSHALAPGSMVAGGLAGIMCWIPIVPIDLVKSRVQANDVRLGPRELVQFVAQIFRNEGWQTFFKGGTMIFIRAFATNLVTLSLYHYCEQGIKRYT